MSVGQRNASAIATPQQDGGTSVLEWAAAGFLVVADLFLILVLAGGAGPFGLDAMIALLLLATACSLAVWAIGLRLISRLARKRSRRNHRLARVAVVLSGGVAAVAMFRWVIFAPSTPVAVLVGVPVGLGIIARFLPPPGERRAMTAFALVAALTVAPALPLDAANRATERRLDEKQLQAVQRGLAVQEGICVDQVAASASDEDLAGGSREAVGRLAPEVRSCVEARYEGSLVECSDTTCRWSNNDPDVAVVGSVVVRFDASLARTIRSRVSPSSPEALG